MARSLVQKLGLDRPGRACVIGAFREWPVDVSGARMEIDPEPVEGVIYDIQVLFAQTDAHLRGRLAIAMEGMAPSGAIWLAWPKKLSDVTSALSFSVVQGALLERGLVDVKVCAMSDVWSGLKAVVPVADRPRPAA